MRKVIWSKPVNIAGTKLYTPEEQGEALFHQWGLGAFHSGGPATTSATIELEDGTVKNVPAEQIRFVSGEIGKSTEVEKYKKQIHDLNEAIEWALGYDTAHKTLFDPPMNNKPRYWWRKILAQFRDKALDLTKDS